MPICVVTAIFDFFIHALSRAGMCRINEVLVITKMYKKFAYKDLNKAEQANLPQNTPWLTVRRVARIEKTYDSKALPDPEPGPNQCVVRYWAHQRTLCFLINLGSAQAHSDATYGYNFFAVNYGKKVDYVDRVALLDEAKRQPLIEQQYSAYYLYCVCRLLASYREPIDLYALAHLDHVINHGLEGDDSCEPVKQGHLTPPLMYQHLVRLVRPSIVVRAPGKSQPNLQQKVVRCLCEPVYGVSHQPLRLTLKEGGHYWNVFFGAYPLSSEEQQQGVYDIVVPALGPTTNLTYDVLDFVAQLSALFSLQESGVNRDLVVKFLRHYRPDATRQQVLRAERVSAIMQPSVLYAIKLAQLFSVESRRRLRVEESVDVVPDIDIDDQYKEDDDPADPDFSTTTATTTTTSGRKPRQSIVVGKNEQEQEQKESAEEQRQRRAVMLDAKQLLAEIRGEYVEFYQQQQQHITNNGDDNEPLIEQATTNTIRNLINDIRSMTTATR